MKAEVTKYKSTVRRTHNRVRVIPTTTMVTAATAAAAKMVGRGIPRASAEAHIRARQVSRSSSGSGAAPASGRSARTTSGPRSRLRSGPGIAPALQVAAPTTCKHEGR